MCLSDRETLLISSSFTKMHRSTVLKYLQKYALLKVKQYTIPNKICKTGWKFLLYLVVFYNC